MMVATDIASGIVIAILAAHFAAKTVSTTLQSVRTIRLGVVLGHPQLD
jgi:hypothetical protein